MRRNRFWKRPFALALSLCILFSAFGQISYAGDSAETEPVTQVIDEASSNPNSSSEPGTQSQGGQDENVPDDSAAGGDTSGDDQTDGDNPGGDSTESDNTGDKESGGDSTEDGNTGDEESGGDSTEGDNTGDKEPDGDKTEGDNTGDKEPDGDKTEGDNIGDKEPGGDKTESDNIGDKDPDKNENPDSDGTQDQWVKVCPKHMEHDDSCGYIEGKHSCEHSCYYCVSLCEHHQDHSNECGFHDPDEGGEGAECNYSCEICNKTAEPSLPVCPNHPIHDESCGYMEGTSPCGHSCEYCQNLCEHHLKHDDECGYKEGESPCKFSCPVCGEELKNLCKHHTAHDESCGYIKGESPCTRRMMKPAGMWRVFLPVPMSVNIVKIFARTIPTTPNNAVLRRMVNAHFSAIDALPNGRGLMRKNIWSTVKKPDFGICLCPSQARKPLSRGKSWRSTCPKPL